MTPTPVDRFRGGATRQDASAFVRDNLALASPPGLAPIKLYTAHPASGLRRLAGSATPYWAYPWPGGMALARFVLDRPQTVEGRRVLDLGCGGGLVGIAAARAGAAAVLACDTDPLARTAAALNAEANGVALLPLADAPADGIDIVLAGDVFYSRAVTRRTAACLIRYREAGLAVLVGDPGREHLPRASLRELARYPVTEFGGACVTACVFAFEPRGAAARPAPSQPAGKCSKSAAGTCVRSRAE